MNHCSSHGLDALDNAVLAISALTAPMSSIIVSILTERCIAPLNVVGRIRTDFRAKPSKQLPTAPHSWVSSILRPVKMFFGIIGNDGFGAVLKDDHLEPFVGQIFENVCEK